MTSVMCNVCSESVAIESDRIYCFGGCGQIFHTRCSDLSPSGAKAIHENNGLKYMCFDCRKRQITLNDIQNQCAQLTKTVNDLFDCINKNNLALPALVKTEIHKNNAVLLPRIVSAIKSSDRSNSLHTAAPIFETVGNDKPSYANVVQNSNESKGKKRKAPDDLQLNHGKRKASTDSPAIITLSGNVVANNFEEGGLLRSGKRRNVAHPPSNSVSTPLLQPQPLDSHSFRSPQRKSSTVLKMEQTVLIKPNQAQPAETTKRVICGKLDPIEFAVKDLHLRDSGEIAVRCESKDLALKLVKAATENFSEDYTISIQKPLKPRLKIIGFSTDMDEEKLLACLRKQNLATHSLDLKVIRIVRSEKRKSNQMSVILKTDACGFDVLMKLQRVNLGWERCRVIEATDVRRCFNCSEYGHKAELCSKPACCPKCSGDHKVEECEEEREKCINCHIENSKRQSRYEELLDTTHSSWSNECPVYVKQLKRARQRIDFSI